MNQKLPNFSRADEAMRVAEDFFRGAGSICLRQSHAAQKVSDRMFLAYAAHSARRLAGALEAQCKGPDTHAQKTFTQYAPSEPAPSEDELGKLADSDPSAPRALELLARSSQGWVRVFSHFESAADTEREQELHAACARLIDSWQRDLSAAFQQRDAL